MTPEEKQRLVNVVDLALSDSMVEASVEDHTRYDYDLFAAALAGNGFKVVPCEPSKSPEVTPEMIDAGCRAYLNFDGSGNSTFFAAIYSAMEAARSKAPT